jgi:hypothetical protein
VNRVRLRQLQAKLVDPEDDAAAQNEHNDSTHLWYFMAHDDLPASRSWQAAAAAT